MREADVTAAVEAVEADLIVARVEPWIKLHYLSSLAFGTALG